MTLDDYVRLNKSYSKRLIFHFGTGSGFFSEYNNMLRAMAYCLINEIRFTLYSADATFSFEKGWLDFFEPFTDEVTDSFHSKLNKRFLKRSITRNFSRYLRGLLVTLKYRKADGHLLQYFKFYKESANVQDIKMRYKFDYFTYDLWSSFQEMELAKHLNLNGIFNGSVSDLMKTLDELIWQFNDNTALEIANLVSQIELPQDYIGMQIRGGDKFMENEIVDSNLYFNTLISKLDLLKQTNSVFVLTDDYRIIQKTRDTYPQFTIFTFCSESERGYFNDAFIEESIVERKQKIIRLLASIKILSNSTYFIGTESANPGKYLKLRLGDDRFHSLD